MWLDRITNQISRAPNIVHLDAEPAWGTHFIISELGSRKIPVVWIHLAPGDSEIVIGNKLSDALHRAFDFRLFGYGLPLHYCVKRFADASSALGPFWISISGVHSNSLSLAPFFHLDSKIILSGASFKVPDTHLKMSSRLTHVHLRMTLDDALHIARDQTSLEHLISLYESSSGKYEVFLSALQSALELPPPERPYPEGYQPLGGASPVPDDLIDSHVKRGYWIEAFEVAIRHSPGRVPHLVENAAEQYLDRGLVARLSDRVSAVADKFLDDERVVYWQLYSAIATNTHRALIPALKEQIDLAAMPNVRAVLAIQELTRDSLTETKAALDSRRTLVTARAHAFCLTQFGMPEEAIALLMSALHEAQTSGRGRELITIASTIAHAIALQGEYHASLSWADWALAGFKKYDVNEELEQLYIKSQVQYMRLLSGVDTKVPLIPADIVEFDLAGIPTFEAVLSTIGDFEFVQGNYDGALAMYERNRIYQSRDQSGHFGLDACRALLALGRVSEAQELAAGVVALAEGTNRLNFLKAKIACGLTQSACRPDDAFEELEKALEDACDLGHWDIAAMVGISLASAYLRSSLEQEAVSTLSRSQQGLKHLGVTGWHLFGGWLSNFDQVRELWRNTTNPVGLTLLGESSLRRNGDSIKLSLRNAEILAVLCLHPEGLSGEQLSEKLYSDEKSKSTLKATLSKLRNLIAIGSQPYSLAEHVKADFQVVESLLRQGKANEAVNLYKGQLLANSTAPAIVSHREYLDEAVRQAALQSTDVELLFEYAQTREADLEVWEALDILLDEVDTRGALVRARVNHLREEWGVTR